MAEPSPLQPEARELEQGKRKRQQRLENAKIVAETIVHTRGLRLRAIQDRDKQTERRLLFEGINANLNADSLEADPWFVSEDMSGEKNYILQYMGAYMKRFWSKEALENIQQLASDTEWIKQRFLGHIVVSLEPLRKVSS